MDEKFLKKMAFRSNPKAAKEYYELDEDDDFDEDDEEFEDDYDYAEEDNSAQSHGLLGALGFVSLFGGKGSKAGKKFRIGDHVRVIYRDEEGTIIDITSGGYLVKLQSGKTITVKEAQLEHSF